MSQIWCLKMTESYCLRALEVTHWKAKCRQGYILEESPEHALPCLSQPVEVLGTLWCVHDSLQSLSPEYSHCLPPFHKVSVHSGWRANPTAE